MDYRRYGVGTALMNAFMEKAKSAGYKKLILWTASPLTDAIHHYEKLGFQRTDSVENHTWSTEGVLVEEIKMEMELNENTISFCGLDWRPCFPHEKSPRRAR